MRPAHTHNALADPEPGFFKIRMVRKGPYVPAQIILENGLWSAKINNAYAFYPVANPFESWAVMKAWHGQKIERSEYEYLVDLQNWAEKYDPSHPAANPDRPVDLISMEPVWRSKNGA